MKQPKRKCAPHSRWCLHFSLPWTSSCPAAELQHQALAIQIGFVNIRKKSVFSSSVLTIQRTAPTLTSIRRQLIAVEAVKNVNNECKMTLTFILVIWPSALIGDADTMHRRQDVLFNNREIRWYVMHIEVVHTYVFCPRIIPLVGGDVGEDRCIGEENQGLASSMLHSWCRTHSYHFSIITTPDRDAIWATKV